MHIQLSIRSADRFLACMVVLLACAGLASEIALYIYVTEAFGLVPLMNLSYEGNLPTWYCSSLLFVCAVLLASIAALRLRQQDRFRWHWLALSVIFLYISIDESVVIHELINEPLRDWLELDGALYFAWVLPFGTFVVLFAMLYLRFLGHLTPRFRRLFVTAGAVYVGGALGTEFAVSAWYDDHGGTNIVYGMLNLIQETLEIAGASIFCATLLRYLAREWGTLRLIVTDATAEERPARSRLDPRHTAAT